MNTQTQLTQENPKSHHIMRRNHYIPAFVIFRNADGPIQEESE